MHVLGALLFAVASVRSILLGDVVNAVMSGVLAALIVVLGVSIARFY